MKRRDLIEATGPPSLASRCGISIPDKIPDPFAAFLPMTLDEYLELLDWTGRQLVRGKRGTIPAELAPILARLDIATDDWLELAVNFGRLFNRVAGRPATIAWQRTRHGGRFRPGHARMLGSRTRAG